MSDDTLLTGLIDGQLPADEIDALELRLRREPALLARFEQLRATPPLAPAFDALLQTAPVERMQARLAEGRRGRTRFTPPRPAWAGVAAALFLAGVVVGWGAFRAKPETWRDAVRDYMALYVGAPFPQLSGESLTATVTGLSGQLQLKLDPATLGVDGLSPRFAAALRYDGAPLAEIGYLDGDQAIALCIIKDGEPDSPPTASAAGPLASVSWAKDGRGYLAIGATTRARIAAFAKAAQDNLAKASSSL